MPSNKIGKRVLIFSIIIFCGFIFAYIFLRKQHSATNLIEKPQPIKKDSSKIVTLISEKIGFENEANASTEKASSGKYSYKITQQIEYGFGVNKLVKDIPNFQTLNQIDIDLKCWMKKKVEAVYVLSIEDANGKSVFWDNKPIACNKNEDWCSIHFTFNINQEAIKPDYIIKLYPWNKAKEEFYIDDISVNYLGTEKINSSSSIQASTANFFYNFETNDGLTGTESVKETTAHSGKMASDLSGGKEYGPLIIKRVSDVSSGQLKRISASVWVYPLTDNSNVVLTASISNPKGESVFWDGKSTDNKQFPKNKWTKLNASYVLPFEKIGPDDKIQVNIWNKGRTNLIIDDMEIVYGESTDRIGNESTIDANTIYEKQFVPLKNKPPFKTIYFTKKEINTAAIADFTPNDEFVVGDFIKDKNNLEEIICIKDGKAAMFQYSIESKQFKIVSGKSLSIDSLIKIKKEIDYSRNGTFFKPSDVVFSGDYYGDNKTEILNLNTDWRFDAKLIKQDKEQNAILGNVDFKGYSNDYNPKYYEFTKILSGKFISSTKSSLIVISCNCADTDFKGKHCNQFENVPALPNCVSLYSIENK